MLKTTKCFRLVRGIASTCRLLSLLYIGATAACNSRISSKLVATKIVVPPEQGSEIAKDGITVSVEPGTFANAVEIDVEATKGGVEISTLAKDGTKILSGDVLKDLRFCSIFDPSYDQAMVYVLVDISEDQSIRSETIGTSEIEFSAINGKPQGCWLSRYVNASFQIMASRSPAVAAKLTDPNCIDPDVAGIPNNQVLTLCDGTIATGTLDLANLQAKYIKAGVVIGGVLGTAEVAPGKCNSDGALGCVTSASFPAADRRSVVASDLKAGKTLAGIVGNYAPDFPDAGHVYNDSVNGVVGTLTLPAVGDVYSGVSFGVAGTGSMGTLTVPAAANVRTANGVFGQNGTAITPTLADCSTDGGIACVTVAAFKAADMTNVVPAKIKSGVTIAGVVGDYPSATNALAGADGTADLVLATFDAKIKAATNFEWFDSSGNRYVNSGDADIVDGNIASTANIFGTQGIVTVPTSPDAWDIRAGQVVNGVTGKLKVACRNSGNTTLFDAGEFKNATADSTLNFFTVPAHGYANNDTIRFTAETAPTGLTATTTTYYVRSSTVDSFQLATLFGGEAIDFTTNGANIAVYKWGGGIVDIWDTVDDFNYDGVPFTATSTPAPWTSDNFCGGVGVESSSDVWTDTTTDSTCDNPSDECRFRDKISGLEWSELQSAGAAWGLAMTTCANLSFGGSGAWRLPTQKELMTAYVHGIYSARNANWLSKDQINFRFFWSSTMLSFDENYARVVFLDDGYTFYYPKSALYQVVCVR